MIVSTEARRLEIILDAVRRCPAAAAAAIDASVGLEALDDCAVIPMAGGVDLIIGTDFIRGEGFNLFKKGILSRRDIGYYLVGANASDLAAMGAAPLGIVVAYRYDESLTDDAYREVVEGIAAACSDFGMPLLGGDSGSYEANVLSATAFGICPAGKTLLRCNGKPGDRLFLTGTVGTAAAALAYFNRCARGCVSQDIEDELLQSWQRIRPALDQGRYLVEASLSTCGIDTSDGLHNSCKIIAAASGCDLILDSANIPISQAVKEVAKLLRMDTLSLALALSVDFRLLFTAAPDRRDRVIDGFRTRQWSVHEIGELVEPDTEPQMLLRTNGGLGTAQSATWSDLVPPDETEASKGGQS